MFDIGHAINDIKSPTEDIENKVSTLEERNKGLVEVDSIVDKLFGDDVHHMESKYSDGTVEGSSINESHEVREDNHLEKDEEPRPTIKELFDQIFLDDFIDSANSMGENEGTENDVSDVEKNDQFAEEIARSISTPEGIQALIDKHPEKSDLWQSQMEALETLNDSDASPAEIRSAQAKLSNLKGQLMEVAAKDALSNAGFDVEAQQRVVEGESGGTRPDVIATNNTEHSIEVFGMTIQPGETISVECKCGGSQYMTNQLNEHIPNQLSGQEGTKVLLTTSDINGTPDGLASSVCSKYDAKLVALDISVADVENAIKEVAE